MATIRTIDSLDIKEISRQIGKTYIYCEDRSVSHMINLYSSEMVRDIVIDVVVSDKSKQCNDLGGINTILINELPENMGFSIVVIDRNKELVIEKLKRYQAAEIYVPDQAAVDKLYENNSNKDTLEYYSRFQSEPLLFQYIEIETVNRCNGTCGFCPVNRNEKQRPYHKMTDELFHKIIDELNSMDYTGQVALFSNNEPFIDDRIPEFAGYARNRLPKACLYLFTNGILLTEEKFRNTIHYLNFIQIDTYIEDELPEPEYVQSIRKWADEEKVSDKMIYFRISPDTVRYSRGGSAPNKKKGSKVNELCRLPLTQMVVRPDGKISLCCNDALGQYTLGDVNKSTLREIWNSEEYRRIRGSIIRGRDNIDLCRNCDTIDRRSFKP